MPACSRRPRRSGEEASFVRRARSRVATWCAAGAAIAIGVACDGLWVGDTPRPTLKEHDSFCVAPACPELVIDSSAIASVEPTVTITARRSETNLGAESVPVDVTIGSCASADDASAPDGSSSEQDGGGSGTLGPQCKPNASVGCTTGFNLIDPATAAHFELIEDNGCKKASSTQLNCTLDPSGQATFRVRSLDTSSPALLADYLPICVRPATKAEPPFSFDTEVRVVPRAGTARFAAAIVKVDDIAPTPAAGTPCDSLIADCNARVVRARLRAGIISADVAQGSTRQADFRIVQRDLTIAVALDQTSSQAFLSSDANCTQADGGAVGDGGTVSLTIERGQRESAPFFLCAPSKAASFRLIPTLSGTATDAGAGSASNSAVENRPLELDEVSLAKGYSVDPDQRLLLKTTCDGESAPASKTDFVAITPPLAPSPTNNTVVVGSCEASTSTDAAAQDAGDGGTCSIPLTLVSGGTCTL